MSRGLHSFAILLIGVVWFAHRTWALECAMSIRRVTDAADGYQGNFHAGPGYPADGGRSIAFASLASNLLPGDDNEERDIFWRAVESNNLLLVSIALDGGFGDRRSTYHWGACSGDLVVFTSHATNLIEDDTNEWKDVFVRDMELGVTTRVSVFSEGGQADGASDAETISGDGHVVAFASHATNLVPDDTNGRRDVFVHDLWTRETTLVSVATDGTQGNSYSYNPSLSYDGRYVAFESIASNLAPSDPSTREDIYVHDRLTGVTTHVSRNEEGQAGNGASTLPQVSGDGRYVTFGSSASNLVPDDTNGRSDVFVVDRFSFPPSVERISLSSDGQEANGSSSRPYISLDGRFITFSSYATNLAPEGAGGGGDIYLRDRLTRTTEKVSRTIVDEWGDAWSIYGQTSCDGQYVAFLTSATNMVPGELNGYDDVYLRKLDEPPMTPGDGDCDGDFDLHDFAVFQACRTTVGLPSPIQPECYPMDFDFDGKVLWNDYIDFVALLAGPGS